ncbi:Dipeptide transport system permease protein DppB (plasmid) [Rhodococcus sp. WAY2]|nr:Dipeptide transport system permease protein DppB [Rhodococcus sp. WAY2]
MIAAIVRRVLLASPVLAVVALVAFLLVEATPGDPAAQVAGDNATPERIEEVRVALGLNQPLIERFGDYIGGLASGDLGDSLVAGQSVASMIGEALPLTLSLAFVAMILVVLIGIPAGMAAAVRRGGYVDRAVTAVGSFFIGIPPFVFGLLLVIALVLTVRAFPATGYVSIAEGGVSRWLSHLILPGLALALPSAAEVARQLRGALVDVLEQDYIRTQRAKGLKPSRILLKHGLKNAAPPVLTVLGLQIGRILGGAVIVEQVFAIPGYGSLAFSAVTRHDLPLIQAVVLVSAVAVIVINLLTDLIETVVNPRLRSSS